MYLRLALILAVFTAVEATAEDHVSTLVKKVVTAYGGPALPALGEGLRQSGTTYSNRRGVAGAIIREVRWPDYLRVEIAYGDGGRETRRLAGDEGFRDGAPATAPMTAAMRLQAARLSLPMLLEWEADGLRDLGGFTGEAGRPVRRVAIALDEGLTLFVEIEEDGGRILRSAGVMTFGGAEMAFGATYSQPGEFGALSWPTREDQVAMGQPTGWTEITSVEVVTEFLDGDIRR